jgi:hypothetical protein
MPSRPRRTLSGCRHVALADDETQSSTSGWVTLGSRVAEEAPHATQQAMHLEGRTPPGVRDRLIPTPCQPRLDRAPRGLELWPQLQGDTLFAAPGRRPRSEAHTRLLGPAALWWPCAPRSCAALPESIKQSQSPALRAWHGRKCCQTSDLSGCICHDTANEANCHVVHPRRCPSGRPAASSPGDKRWMWFGYRRLCDRALSDNVGFVPSDGASRDPDVNRRSSSPGP